MKKVIFAVLMVCSMGAWAGACDLESIKSLPESVQKDIKNTCENSLRAAQEKADHAAKMATPAIAAAADGMKNSAAQTAQTVKEAVSPEKLSSYAEAAKAFAEAIGLAATKLGMSINEFLKTPAGLFTILVIVWKVFGTQLLGILSVAGVLYMTKKLVLAICFASSETVQVGGGFFGTRTKIIRKYHPYKNLEESQAFWAGVTIVVGAIASIAIGCSTF